MLKEQFIDDTLFNFDKFINSLYDNFNEYNSEFKVTEDIKQMVILERKKNCVKKQLKISEEIISKLQDLQLSLKNEKGN